MLTRNLSMWLAAAMIVPHAGFASFPKLGAQAQPLQGSAAEVAPAGVKRLTHEEAKERALPAEQHVHDG